MKSGVKSGFNVEYRGRHYCRLSIIFIVLVLFVSLSLGAGGVFAVNETLGPGGYGWQQVFTNGGSGVDWARLTGSADRMNYSYGYKNVQIYVREEDYWSQDCGWWYVGGGNTTGIRIVDGAGDTLVATSGLTPSQGRNVYSYAWGSDDDPGRWIVYVNDTMNNLAVFYLYVKGQLNVSVNASATPTAGSPVTIYATITDNTGASVPANRQDNNGTTITPTITAYVSGAGESFTVTLSDGDNDGVYTNSFTPSNMGDHMVTVKATDGDAYWVDGRGSTTIAVTGSFPASVGLAAVLRTFGGLADAGLSSMVAVLAGIIGALLGRRWYR
jgi:hypothetical protein